MNQEIADFIDVEDNLELALKALYGMDSVGLVNLRTTIGPKVAKPKHVVHICEVYIGKKRFSFRGDTPILAVRQAARSICNMTKKPQVRPPEMI